MKLSKINVDQSSQERLTPAHHAPIWLFAMFLAMFLAILLGLTPSIAQSNTVDKDTDTDTDKSKNIWSISGAVSNSRYASDGQVSNAIHISRTMLSTGPFSFGLGSGFENSQDFRYNSIPLNVEARYKTPLEFNAYSPFIFAESGILYAVDYSLGANGYEIPVVDGIGADFSFGFGLEKAFTQNLSYEFALSGRMQFLPTSGFTPSRDFPGLILPAGTGPFGYSLSRSGVTMKSIVVAFGLRF